MGNLKGILRGPGRFTASALSPAAPPRNGLYVDKEYKGVATGIYRDNVRQTRQFQDVLESLRLQHRPEHWASWALDGSLEEDAGRFPVTYTHPNARFEDRFNAKILTCSDMTVGQVAVSYGNVTDFAWIHLTRHFTIGFWSVQNPLNTSYDHWVDTMTQDTRLEGFEAIQHPTNAVSYFDISSAETYERQLLYVGMTYKPQFQVFRNFGDVPSSYTGFLNAENTRNNRLTSPYSESLESASPLSLIRARGNLAYPGSIWNVFITNHILSDDEIYRLYLAGLNDIQMF